MYEYDAASLIGHIGVSGGRVRRASKTSRRPLASPGSSAVMMRAASGVNAARKCVDDLRPTSSYRDTSSPCSRKLSDAYAIARVGGDVGPRARGLMLRQ